jgi:hypothetical protein
MDGEISCCSNPVSDENFIMSAAEIIEQIKGLPANERARVAKFPQGQLVAPARARSLAQ